MQYSYCLFVGGRSLAQLRQMFFRMKRAIFSNSPSEIAFNSSILNDFIRNIIGCDMRICDVKEPRFIYLVSIHLIVYLSIYLSMYLFVFIHLSITEFLCLQ